MDDVRELHALQRDALDPFVAMKAAAARDGIEIEIVSAFRDFASQQNIWDRKYRGERPLYDEHGEIRDHSALGPVELVDAIACWSAVPGGSRHFRRDGIRRHVAGNDVADVIEHQRQLPLRKGTHVRGHRGDDLVGDDPLIQHLPSEHDHQRRQTAPDGGQEAVVRWQ